MSTNTGPGKYDDVCTVARLTTGAAACVVVIVDGYMGNGLSVQATDRIRPEVLAGVLEDVARGIRAELAAEGGV